MSEISVKGISQISNELREQESYVEERKREYSMYEEAPYEGSVLFVKNFEKLPEDPSSFTAIQTTGASIPSGMPFSFAALGTKSKVNTLQKGVGFVDARNDGRPLLGTPLPKDADKMSHLNAAFRNSYHIVTVAPGEVLQEPVVRLTVSPPERWGNFRKTEMELGEASSSIFIDRIADAPDSGKEPALLSDVVDVRLKSNSVLTYVTLCTGGRERISHNTRFVLDNGARLTYVTWYAASPYVRARTNVILKGEGSEANLYWGGFPKDGSRYDYLVCVEHLGRSTRGFALQRGLVKGQSRMLLKGLMTIRNSAINADSHLSQHALLLTRDSFANAIPGLEIETNELKAKHSASVSQPDEDQLFYLMSRGLTREESLMEVAGGYLNPLAVNIPDKAAREAFEAEIGKALKG
jgi:Fe-S cluster assembly protein SufB